MVHALRTRRRRFVAAVVIVLLAAAASAAPGAASGQGGRGRESRVDALLARMTLDEKLTLLSGTDEDPATKQYQAGYLPGIPRLGIPSLRLADGPPGVATSQLSTGMTQTMGVAATFDPGTARANGVVIGRDARALGQDVVLEPFINLHRDPASGRDWNTFGEDPLLTGAMGAATIQGVQSQGVMAQAKHYVAYDGASGNVVVDEQTLEEIYVRPFADAVDAGVSSVMCSYNRVNNAAACGNAATLNGVLKGQLGFDGFVTSDWGANHGVDFLAKGLDLEMPGTGLGGGIPPLFTKDNLKAALAAGTVTLSQVDGAVRRILGQYDRFGLLAGHQKHEVTPEPVARDEQVVRQTAERAATLLKNDGGALPLDAADLGSLAMIGPGAGQTMATGGGGEKSTGRADRWVGTVDAIRRTVPGARVTYAVGDDMTGTAVPAAALSHDGAPGLLRTDTATGATSVDPVLSFTTAAGTALPAGGRYTWTGTVTAPETGAYWIDLGELGTNASVAIDGGTVIRASGFGGAGPRFGTIKAGDDGVLPTTDGLDGKRVQVTLTAGPHALSVATTPDVSGAPTQLHLNWVTPAQQRADEAAAVAAARSARTAVVFAWNTGPYAAALPEGQDRLISEVAAANPRTIVVVNTHEPFPMPWLGGVRAVLNMWFPGDEGGWATADVLLGRANPAGRLPYTWPAALTQGVANDPAHPERASRGVNPGTSTPCTNTASGPGAVPDCETDYSEGIDIGYRWYDRQGLTPLFPFGYGLSYSTFQYRDPHVTRQRDGSLRVTATVTNTGDRTGDEVPQLYLGAPDTRPAGIQFAVRALGAFDRITLRPHQSRTVTLTVARRDLSYWSPTTHRWTLATGTRTVYIGASSRDLRLRTPVTIAQ